jgi:DNA-binding NarL/FixJ family response regulator
VLQRAREKGLRSDVAICTGTSDEDRLLRWIKAVPDPPRVVVLIFQDEPGFRDRAMALRADGFVTKAEMARHLLPAVEALYPDREATP